MQFFQRVYCQRTVTFHGLAKTFSRLVTSSSLWHNLCMSKTFTRSSPMSCEEQNLASSDGDLHLAESNGRGSSHSLDGSRAHAGKVASWAVSFERLLEDPMGVEYFTTFLKSEVSAENILFWQACEKFRKIPASLKEELIQEARSIYEDYLSDSASYAINIDDTARIEERDLRDPKPDMFHKAQQQIFKLMKFDSYTRFVRSPLYQSCMLADVEGRPLPHSKNSCSAKNVAADGDAKKKKKVKSGEDVMDRKRGTPNDKEGQDKQRDKRGSWAEPLERGVNIVRNESQSSVKSTGSVELTYLSSKAENGSSSQRDSSRVEKYCCVYLPDGTASLAPARSGLPVREMLMGLCEKRGFSLSDVVIYLQGKDKSPLSLDQDSFVLKDQQVLLEVRVKFTLEIVFTGQKVGIMAKSSKSLLDALSSVMQKHNIRPQDAVVTLGEKKEPLNLSMNIFSLANKKLHLDKVNGSEQSSVPNTRLRSSALQAQDRSTGTVEVEQLPLPLADTVKSNSKTKNPAVRKADDMDGLIDLLSKATCQADDQRGLLRKEHLVIPEFLQLRKVGEEKDGPERSTQGALQSARDPPTSSGRAPATTLPSSSSAPGVQPCSLASKDLTRETAV